MNPLSCNLRVASRFFAGFTAILVTTWLSGAASGTISSADAARHYIMFVGAELIADCGDEQHRVVGVSSGSVEIKGDAEAGTIPFHRVKGFRTVRGMRLSTSKASIDKLRAASIRTTFNREQAESDFAFTAVTRAAEREAEQVVGDIMIGQAALGPRSGEAEAERERKLLDVSENLEQVARLRDVMDDYLAKRPDELERAADSHRAAGKAGPGRHALAAADLPFDYEYDPFADGLELRCEVSCPHPLEKAYLAVTIRYLDPRRPGRTLQRVAVQTLDRVEAKPRKVKVSLPGMPRSFRLLGCHLNLYGNGHDVATNLSEMQVAMTEEQAYQYFLVDYLSRHRGKTRPPAPVLFAQPGEVLAQVNRAELQQEIHARVDEHGGLVALSMDEAATREVAPQVLSVMRFIRFYPGLENGKPVDGRIRFKPADLIR